MGRFVGRTTEIKQLAELVVEGRELTICGAPGIGKSRLAVEVVGIAGRHFDDVKWVDLAPVSLGELVPGTLATSVDAPEQPGATVTDSVVACLRGRHVLIVLDNCEHLIDACASLADTVLRSCPEVTILATSREPLAIDGERRWRVPPLSTGESVELFHARGSVRSRRLTMGDDSPAAIVDICGQLEGIPLSIELAVGRIGALEPAAIADGLRRDPLAVLDGGHGASDDRHRSLRAALDWSYALLSEPEQALLRRLAVFSGGCTLDAARAVCTGAPVERGNVFEVLASLVGKSMVVARTVGKEARYSLLTAVGQYAHEQLECAGEEDSARAAHARWCVDMAEASEPELTGRAQPEALASLDAERDNLRAGIEWSLEHSPLDAVRMAASLTVWWRVRSRFAEGREWLETALASDADCGPALRAKALWGTAFLAHMLGDNAAAHPLLDESLALARAAGDLRGQGRALLLQGNVAMRRDDDALELLTSAAEVAARAGDTWCRAHALALAGMVELDAGRVAEARRALEDAVATAREADDLQSLRIGLHLLGRLTLAGGDAPGAEEYLSEALAATESLGDLYGVAAALKVLGDLALWLGAYDRSTDAYERALAAARELSLAPVTARALTGLGDVALAQGRVTLARRHFGEASRFDGAGERPSSGAARGLGSVAAARDDLASAREFFDQAIGAAEASGDRLELAAASFGLGQVEFREGHKDEAVVLWRRALSTANDVGDWRAIAESLEALAGAAARGRKALDGARLFGAAEEMRSARGCPLHPAECARVDEHVTFLRERLPAEEFDPAWADGAAMLPEESIGLALTGRRKRPASGWPSLTPSEKNVVRLVAEGCSNREIAERLYISRNTVQTHVSHIFAKLSISSRAKLAREAALRGGV